MVHEHLPTQCLPIPRHSKSLAVTLLPPVVKPVDILSCCVYGPARFNKGQTELCPANAKALHIQRLIQQGSELEDKWLCLCTHTQRLLPSSFTSRQLCCRMATALAEQFLHFTPPDHEPTGVMFSMIMMTVIKTMVDSVQIITHTLVHAVVFMLNTGT